MRYLEFRTSTPNHAIISEFWRFEAGKLPGPVDHIIPPDGLVSVWFVRQADGGQFCGVTGPAVKAVKTVVQNGMTIIGVRMKPGAPARFMAQPLCDIAGAILPLADAAPSLLAPFTAAAPAALTEDFAPLEAVFDAIDAAAPPIDAAAAHIAELLIASQGSHAIGALAAAEGLSMKSARRRFLAATGLNPKDFARMRRIRRACIEALHDDSRWSAVSLEAGFADQAHLAREFRDIFDLPPSEVKKALMRIRHNAVISG